MSNIIRFGEYWSIGTFSMFLCLGLFVSVCCHYASSCKNACKKSICTVNRREILYFVVFIILWGLYSFRDITVGADTAIYIDRFLHPSEYHFDFRRLLIFKQDEILYDLFTIGFRKITDNYVAYLAVIGAIIAYTYVTFFATFWEKGNSFVTMILFVIVFQYNFGALRSAIGEMFLLLSLCQLAKKETKKALILSVIGSLFHYTILINILFIIWYRMVTTNSGINKTRLYLTVASSILMLIALSSFLKKFFLITRYRAYIPQTESFNIGYWYIIVSFVLAILMARKKNIMDDRVKIAIMASCFSLLMATVASLFGAYRLVGYYSLVRYYMWDRSSDFFFHSKEKRIVYHTVLLFIVLFFLLYQLGRSSETPGFAYKLGDMF